MLDWNKLNLSWYGCIVSVKAIYVAISSFIIVVSDADIHLSISFVQIAEAIFDFVSGPTKPPKLTV